MPLILCSRDENFAWLNRKDPGDLAVTLQNPKYVSLIVYYHNVANISPRTAEYQYASPSFAYSPLANDLAESYGQAYCQGC